MEKAAERTGLIALEADLTLVDGELLPGQTVVLGDDGRIARIGSADGVPRQRLAGQALFPGWVNAHSHAFQRALRGRAERRHPDHPEDNFWTWREEMYALASRLTPDSMYAIARMAYLEMVLGGVTTVGEFHYLHHGPDGVRYDNPDEMALQVCQAAADVGLEIVLLRVAYTRAGFQRSPVSAQKRFFDTRVEACIEAVERLRAAGWTCGVAPHSVRAVPREWLAPLHEFAGRGEMPFHIHVAEQPAEIDACVAETGLRPIQLLAAEGCLDARTTGVHAIHLLPDEIELLGTAKAGVCICPTTERNLGDGIAPADRLLIAGVALSLGSDSHTQIHLLEDAREIEYHLRLQSLSRAVLAERDLLAAATSGGARSLGRHCGVIEAGYAADLVSIDLNDVSVCGRNPDVLTNVVFSMEPRAVRNVWVRGRPVVVDSRHPQQDEIIAAYRKAIA